MTLLEELANASVPGAKIRLALMKRGAKAEQERIIAIIQNKARTTEAPARLLSELALILAEIKEENK